MSIRQEVEKTLKAFADSKGITMAYEGRAFDKPKVPANYIEYILEEPVVINPTVDVLRVRKYGVIQVICFTPDNKGMGPLDILTEEVASLFPVHLKQRFTNFTVEQTPTVSSSFTEGIFRCAVVRVKYRQEL